MILVEIECPICRKGAILAIAMSRDDLRFVLQMVSMFFSRASMYR